MQNNDDWEYIDGWYKYVISDEVYSEDMAKTIPQLCEEIYNLVGKIKNEVYEEEEYCNWLSVEDKEAYKKDCGILDFAYGIYEIAEKIEFRLKALCRKIYLEQKKSQHG
jgi:hypothetical protein